MAADEYYDGPVCYVDGWHYSVVPHPDGVGNGDPGHVYEVPDRKLYLEDDGSYRFATDTDESWHDRTHQQFATVALEDGAVAARVTPEELEAIQRVLGEMRGTG